MQQCQPNTPRSQPFLPNLLGFRPLLTYLLTYLLTPATRSFCLVVACASRSRIIMDRNGPCNSASAR